MANENIQASLMIPSEIIEQIKKDIFEQLRAEMPVEEKILSIKQFGEFLGVSTESARRIANLKGFPSFRIGHRIKVIQSEAVKWLRDEKFISPSDFDGLDRNSKAVLKKMEKKH